MRYFKGTWIVATGFVCAMTAGQVIAQENQGNPSPAPAVANPTNLGADSAHTTPQQAAAPVVDPQAAAQDAADGKSPTPAANSTQSSSAQSANQNSTPAGTSQDFPPPQRQEPGIAGGAQRGGGPASLGANVISSSDGQGIVVARIRPGTPADQMGLRPRDRILSLNGQPVVAVDEFIAAIRGMNVGEEVQLSIDRGGEAQNLGGRLEALREAIASSNGPVRNLAERTRGALGRDRGERVSIDAGPVGVNVQAGYEDGSSGRRSSADVDARISRLEQQIDRLTREIEQLRSGASGASPAEQPGGVGSQPATR